MPTTDPLPDEGGMKLLQWCRRRQTRVVQNGATGLWGWYIAFVNGELIEESARELFDEIVAHRRTYDLMFDSESTSEKK